MIKEFKINLDVESSDRSLYIGDYKAVGATIDVNRCLTMRVWTLPGFAAAPSNNYWYDLSCERSLSTLK